MIFYNKHCVPLLKMFLLNQSAINPLNTLELSSNYSSSIMPPISSYHTGVMPPRVKEGACLDKAGVD